MKLRKEIQRNRGERPVARKVKPDTDKFAGASANTLAVLSQMRLSYGEPDKLSELELIQQVLSMALPVETVKTVAFRLIAQFGSYARAISAPTSELETVEGISDEGIHILKLVRATVIQTLRGEVIKRRVIKNGESLNQYLFALLAHEHKEKFLCLFLDTKNRLIAEETMAEGSVKEVHVYPREVIKKALALHATAIILVHNHPSGDPTPSPDDIGMTRRLKNIGDELGIAIHDHIIIGATGLYSFEAEGRLKY